MQRALYEPGLGYYSAGSVKLGAAGDFITAPELSPKFGQTLAGVLAGWLAQLDEPVIVELGAGSGALAAAILERLRLLDRLPAAYQILEVSADLRARQQVRLRPWGARVQWLDAVPEHGFEGVMLANEVIDALPVARFVKSAGTVLPLGVTRSGRGLSWALGPADAELAASVARIESECGARLPEGYRSEVCRRLPAWLAALAAPLSRGALLVIDYGVGQRDYFRPERHDGTLICHYRHRAHSDPFLWPGLSDLSAWVDYSRLARAGLSCGLQVSGFTTQGEFLLHAGIGELISDSRGDAAAVAEAAALKTLLLPGEMGERFKVMLLTRDLAGAALPGRDFRSRL